METGAKCLYSILTQLMISIMRQSPGEGDQDASSPPQIRMFTLWRHVYYTIESRVTGKTTFSSESPTDVFLFPVVDQLSSQPVFNLNCFYLIPGPMEPDVKGRWLAHISCWHVCARLLLTVIFCVSVFQFQWLENPCPLFFSDCIFIYVGETASGEQCLLIWNVSLRELIITTV